MFSEYYQLRLNSLTENRGLLLEAVKQLAIDSVTVTYSGGGDSGDVDHVSTVPVDALPRLQTASVEILRPSLKETDGKSHYEWEKQQRALEEALRDFALHWVSHHHGGWENNDGGCGEMVMDAKAGTFSLSHNEYFTETEYHEHTL